MRPLEAIGSDAVAPLAAHYQARGHVLPLFEALGAAKLPVPARMLLDHDCDMTPALTAHHGVPLCLRVLRSVEHATTVERTVILMRTSDGEPVEFGAIRIATALFPDAARDAVHAGREPLGALLATHGIVHTSHPQAFFRVTADALIADALQCEPGVVLYGRYNALRDGGGETFARVLEILPPVMG